MKAYFYMLLVVTIMGMPACSEDDPVEPPDPPDPPPTPTLAYAGSDACYPCHQEEYDAWKDSGHASAMTVVAGASPDTAFPGFAAFSKDPAVPPAGHDWDNVSFVIGGYGWKMNWLDVEGYLISGDDAQYNFQDGSRVAYPYEGAPGNRPFTCGRCHATGWEERDVGKAGVDLPGSTGTFFAAGVHCEECHGMGSFHVAEPDSSRMTVDRTSEACARCHRRMPDDAIAAADGFVRTYQQYSEWKASPHSGPLGPGCNDCHDPHASSHFVEAAATGFILSCEGCHPGFDDFDDHTTEVSCVECHMRPIVFSAVSSEPYVADVKSHIINVEGLFADTMFDESGDFLKLDENGKAVISMEYTCMVCHQSGKSASPLPSGLLEAGYRVHKNNSGRELDP